MSIIFSLVKTEDDQFITVFAPGRDPLPASSTHPNFKAIVAACIDGTADVDEVCDLFDIAQTVAKKFQRLSERITVRDGVILLDGDPVHGTLQDQILDFVEAGEGFEPLVNFYEKLVTNPLGNVQDGLFDWIVGQRESGNFTITPDGDIIGYKAFEPMTPKHREGEAAEVYRSSRVARNGDIVNGQEVPAGDYAEHLPGDEVQMPRSIVLDSPSQECGVGLHIGTYGYARSFGSVVMAVRFSPRDIVSLPDRNSAWKLRVCRYTILDIVDAPLDGIVFGTPEEEPDAPEARMDVTFGDLSVGDRFTDEDGDEGEVVGLEDEDGDVEVEYDGDNYPSWVDAADTVRPHGRGGPTSQAAKGNGLNPAQDPKTGQFVQGRPGSQRDAKTGRFAG
jgi:hypothetical protein